MWRRSFSSSAIRELKEKKWDAVVIGGGHNGLTAAAYLGKAGLSVAVLERRHVIGGAAVTEEIIPGFKFSRCSYLQGLLRPCVIRELELKRHGLMLLKPLASMFTPSLDVRYILLWPHNKKNYEEISKFSKRDADAYPRWFLNYESASASLKAMVSDESPEVYKDNQADNSSYSSKDFCLDGQMLHVEEEASDSSSFPEACFNESNRQLINKPWNLGMNMKR